ncbi:CDP-glycerol glycerophosphotransferase family protein [Kineococcus rhizosphaerae]|uniref:CDP-glycerol:poly(Glycerophosphate) glycerophosphotransferase n=1 Tax=Kineococcus rhizosphaerae TaxID=559628 RepID=A0A2T0RAT4_9ACTN|nr:CDP-glycerol glycerophosphotransferase family protein [Kineococcus rhizosphaerae]PRY18250.1 CDP-glycerol:poly(glycerophosphate) glycerophosphotransferase [Kineococcus rhizosphaerae]
MTTSDHAAEPAVRLLLTIEDLTSFSAEVALQAVARLFSVADPVTVFVAVQGVEEPTEELVARILRLCGPAALPQMELVGSSEPVAVTGRVTVGPDAGSAAQAVALLTGVAQSLWGDEERATIRSLRSDHERALAELQALHRANATLTASAARNRAELAIAHRDVRRCGRDRRRPTVVVLFEHLHYWGSVVPVVTALTVDDRVDFVLVGSDAPQTPSGGSAADFLRAQGFSPVSPQWLLGSLDEVDVLIVDNPYDETRLPGLRTADVAAAGVRQVVLPYGNGAIAGEFMDRLLWDLPLQRLAWRAYLPSRAQRDLFARNCLVGADHVRVLGSPKQDRTVNAVPGPGARALRELAGDRRTVLWNPHFRMEPGGWSTFHLYVGDVLRTFGTRDDLFLVVRPHPRLLTDLLAAGGKAAELARQFCATVEESTTMVLDTAPDYQDAVDAADALISDLSSIATEFLLTGKPVMYLQRLDGPGVNEEGRYFDAMYQGRSWADVEAFLALVARGEDPRRVERAATVREHFLFADGKATGRIIDDLLAALHAERAATEPAVATR